MAYFDWPSGTVVLSLGATPGTLQPGPGARRTAAHRYRSEPSRRTPRSWRGGGGRNRAHCATTGRRRATRSPRARTRTGRHRRRTGPDRCARRRRRPGHRPLRPTGRCDRRHRSTIPAAPQGSTALRGSTRAVTRAGHPPLQRAPHRATPCILRSAGPRPRPQPRPILQGRRRPARRRGRRLFSPGVPLPMRQRRGGTRRR